MQAWRRSAKGDGASEARKERQMISAWEINRYVKQGRTVFANVPGIGDVKVTKARADMCGRIAILVEGSYRNVLFGSIKVEESKRDADGGR